MTAVFLSPTENQPGGPETVVDAALAEMNQRTERRRHFSSHLDACTECDDVLCAAGAELMRAALR